MTTKSLRTRQTWDEKSVQEMEIVMTRRMMDSDPRCPQIRTLLQKLQDEENNQVHQFPISKIYKNSAVRLISFPFCPLYHAYKLTSPLPLELTHESSLRDRSTLRQARKSDLRLQNQQLEDLAPRALPGTKDRQLERKADVRASNNSFANSKFDNAFAEMAEADLMGEEGLDGFKKKKAEEERKKNDREVRREEILRARREEREERVKAYREKEERTMEGLVALARARFG